MIKVAELIDNSIRKIIEEMSYELLGIESLGSGNNLTLRIYIDSDKGISIKDCEIVSKKISAIMDVEDIIRSKYNLEVSSPGFERPLFTIAHYHKFLGSDVKIKLFRPQEGRRKFSGSISNVYEKEEKIEILTNLGIKKLDFNLIEKANLIANF